MMNMSDADKGLFGGGEPSVNKHGPSGPTLANGSDPGLEF